MKKQLIPLTIAVAVVLATGCASSYDKGPYAPQTSKAPDLENKEPIVLMDPGVQYSITAPVYMARTLEDGRLEVSTQLRNRENRRIEVQANCSFKDASGVSIDETPYQTVILTENGTESLKFVSMNDKAKKYTVHVRQAR